MTKEHFPLTSYLFHVCVSAETTVNVFLCHSLPVPVSSVNTLLKDFEAEVSSSQRAGLKTTVEQKRAAHTV